MPSKWLNRKEGNRLEMGKRRWPFSLYTSWVWRQVDRNYSLGSGPLESGTWERHEKRVGFGRHEHAESLKTSKDINIGKGENLGQNTELFNTVCSEGQEEIQTVLFFPKQRRNIWRKKSKYISILTYLGKNVFENTNDSFEH